MLTLGGGGLKTGGAGSGSSPTFTGNLTAAKFTATNATNSFTSSGFNVSSGTLTCGQINAGGLIVSQSSALIRLCGQVADGAAVVPVTIGPFDVYANTTAHLVDFTNGNGGSTMAFIRREGEYVCPSFTDDSATTGNRTVNKIAGFNSFAAAATAVTITNSFVTATSMIQVTIMTNDATALLKNVVPAAGSFTVTLNAAATATTKFAWQVTNFT